jgi:hypothetical protein
MRIDVDIQGINEVNEAFKQVSARFSNPDTRRQIAQAAVPIVIPAIQGATPISSKEHKRYNTPKLVNKLRAPKGLGRVAATYLPGNLRSATIDLATRRKKFAKSSVVVIAPLYSRSKAKIVGKGKSVDAYYAHMVYGSAEAYQKKVLIAGLNMAGASASGAMIDEAVRILKDEKMKTGL